MRKASGNTVQTFYSVVMLATFLANLGCYAGVWIVIVSTANKVKVRFASVSLRVASRVSGRGPRKRDAQRRYSKGASGTSHPQLPDRLLLVLSSEVRRRGGAARAHDACADGAHPRALRVRVPRAVDGVRRLHGVELRHGAELDPHGGVSVGPGSRQA